MLSEILERLSELISLILRMLGLRSSIPDSSKLRIFIKHQCGGTTGTLPLDLDPDWSISQLKEIIGPKLGLQPSAIKIIFSGKELPDELIIRDCNVGQQSYLHAVQIQLLVNETKEKENNTNPPSSSSSLIASTPNEVENEVPVLAKRTDRSNFFVFCGTCLELKEGKLRVRCANCLSGAFTVLKDPQGWDDVLKPNRIPGSCETGSCPTTSFSQFYFKCGSHITLSEDDSSPPLPLIKMNSDLSPCLACGDEKDPIIHFKCTHLLCIDCFKDYLRVRLSERQFTHDSELGYTIGCPASCPNTLIEDCHHFKVVGSYDYDRYQRFGTEEYVLKSGGVLCPQPNCGMGILPLDTHCNKIACLHGCGFVFCRLCSEGWHMGPCSPDLKPSPSSSSSAYKISQYATPDEKTLKVLKLCSKPCPRCRIRTERDGGCMHMECPKCHFNWCWVCQIEWSRECMGNHWFE